MITIPMMIRFHSVSERLRRAAELVFDSLLKKFSFARSNCFSSQARPHATNRLMPHHLFRATNVNYAQYLIVSTKQSGQIRPLAQHQKLFPHETLAIPNHFPIFYPALSDRSRKPQDGISWFTHSSIRQQRPGL